MANRSVELSKNFWTAIVFPGILLFLGLGFAIVPLVKGEMFFYWDNAQQHYAQTAFLHQALRLGQIPQWWPHVGCGFPTIAEGQAAHYHPIRLILALIFPPSIAFMLEIGLYLVLAGLGTYFFLRAFLLRRSACMIGGLCQMFGSFSVVYVRNMALHRSFALLPLAMLLAERFVARRCRFNGIAASIVFSLQLLVGHPTFAVVTIVATTIYVLCRSLQLSWHTRQSVQIAMYMLTNKMVKWGFVIVLGFGIAAIQIVPTFLHVDQSIREGGLNFNYAVNSLPAKIKFLPQLIFPYIYYQGDTFETLAKWGGYFNVVPTAGIYIGALPVLLALLCIWWSRRWSDPAWALMICFIVAVALALGSRTPLFPALRSLPGMNGIRYPSRFLMWASFCLACLAAFGLHKLLLHSLLARIRIWDSIPFVLYAVGIIVLALIFWTQRTAIANRVPIADNYNIGLIKSLLLTAVAFCLTWILLIVKKKRYQSILLVLVTLFIFTDLSLFRRWSGYAPTVSISDITKPPPVVEFLQTDGDQFRVMSLVSIEKGWNKNEDLFEFLQADTCTIWDVESADVWSSLMLKRYYALQESIKWEMLNSDEAAGKLTGYLGALNIKYVVAPQEVTLLGWKKVFQTARAVTWENPAFLPRTFLIRNIVPEKIEIRQEWSDRSMKRLANYHNMVLDWSSRQRDAQIVDNIMYHPVDYKTAAVVAGCDLPQLSESSFEYEISTGSQHADIMTFDVQSQKPALMVVSNNYYPGWSATVNGKPTQIYRANYVGMGIFLPAGKSKVIFRFVTPGFKFGFWISLISISLLIGLIVIYLIRFDSFLNRIKTYGHEWN